jgi:phosphatidylglycerophosphatase C
VTDVVAAFDFDGTLSVRDCVRPFLEQIGGGPRALVLAALRRPVATAGGAVRADRDVLKEVFVGGVYRNRRVDEVTAAGWGFADVIADRLLRDDVLQRLRWHQRQGHRTVFVSASLAQYLVPLAARLGIDETLCTDVVVEHGAGGAVFTDRLLGPNCRGPEKLVRFRRWLHETDLRDPEVWAYGDGRGDRELLGAADHPVWVQGVNVTAEPTEAAA